MLQAGELVLGVFLHIRCCGEQNCLDWTQLRISQLGRKFTDCHCLSELLCKSGKELGGGGADREGSTVKLE